MTLETVVLQQDIFGYGCRDMYIIEEVSSGAWIHGFNTSEGEEACYSIDTLNLSACRSAFSSNHCNLINDPNVKEWETKHSSSQENLPVEGCSPPVEVAAPTTTGRRKRQRRKNVKNQEEVEQQRKTHITVERNRRKQMNNYLSALRSMMPSSYVQRGDQASIVGGAINFVKELEQLLQCLEAHKRIEKESVDIFSDFFTFPQYSTHSTNGHDDQYSMAKTQSEIKADVEVTMVESHANLKVLIRRQPKQLLKIVDGLHSLCFSILHINVTTTADHMVLYSFSVKAEEECQLTSVNEISAAVYEMVGRMQKETLSNFTSNNC